ncbi:YaaC family protein [Bacillus infantis]|uniref:YaaC family protein n=1 Tax=Bacillus infantis TaxID=324767 RepID=UPI003CED47B3
MINSYNGWSSYSVFFSAENTQAYLKKCYTRHGIDQPEAKSYENCYPFIYYLEHGKIYYEQAAKSPLLIQPIMLFYGLVHLIKASILTADPNYPETTSVLAHGVSTRKRKKQQYSFFEDEVKFQKTGLFPFMADKLFHMKHMEGDKIEMGELFKYIPELNELFQQTEGSPAFAGIELANGKLTMPASILDQFHMTEERFIDYFNSKGSYDIEFPAQGESGKITFSCGPVPPHDIRPLKFNIHEGSLSFPLTKGNLVNFPELLLHYLLLYNLSMIARYETEWWSELMKMMPNKDYPFIHSFLEITLLKGPYLVYQYLIGQK